MIRRLSKKAVKQSHYSVTLLLLTFFLFSLAACKPDIKETGGDITYFDLKGFFKADAVILTARNKPVLKTAIHNGNIQTKKVNIDSWDSELSLFSQSDINKPAWKDSYSVEDNANSTIYKAKTPDLETREIVINKAGNKVKSILITNHTKNLLYETDEKLTFITDSMYRIEKTQNVRLLGTNKYDIKGMLN